MPMELYSSEAFVRDIVNAISESEGKPLNIGSLYHHDIDRAYAYQLIAEAKKAIEGQPVAASRRAIRAAALPIKGQPAAKPRRSAHAAALPKGVPKGARAAIAAAKKARRPRVD